MFRKPSNAWGHLFRDVTIKRVSFINNNKGQSIELPPLVTKERAILQPVPSEKATVALDGKRARKQWYVKFDHAVKLTMSDSIIYDGIAYQITEFHNWNDAYEQYLVIEKDT